MDMVIVLECVVAMGCIVMRMRMRGSDLVVDLGRTSSVFDVARTHLQAPGESVSPAEIARKIVTPPLLLRDVARRG